MPDSPLDSGRDPWTHPAVILVATDLSDLDRLMPFAIEQAAETTARLVLLHILASGASLPADPGGMPYYDPAGALEYASKELEPWCELARHRGIVCDGLVREGRTAPQVLAALSQFQADRVLLGTRSRSRLGKLLLGSVAEQVLRSANLPVITVGPEAHLREEGRERIVLHATTLREASRPSAALACRMAASQKAKLVLLHVLPPVDGPVGAETGRSGQPSSLDEASLHEMRILAAQTGAGCCSSIEFRVVHGDPSIEILADASERGASLIVLGATHRSAFENLTRDRIVYRVLAHARCPVLTLREPLETMPVAQPQRRAIHR